MSVADDNGKERKLLDSTLAQIEKQFGEGSIMRLGDSKRLAVDSIPTGSLSLDIALGVGGLPRGRIVEIYGQEGSGKTTVALHALAEAQKAGGTAAFIDAEHAFPVDYAAIIGLDLDELLVSQPDTGEEALEICDMLVRSGAVDAFALDSVAALVPKAELEGEMGDAHVGLQARLMSQALRKLSGSVAKSNTLAIFVNQIREKIGVMFGNPEVTPGGRALKFWSSVRLEVRRTESLKKGSNILGQRVRVRTQKNKVAPPFRQCEFDIIYGQGIWRAGCLVDEGVNFGLVEKAGTWYTYGDERLGQGRDNAAANLEEHPDLADKLESEIRAAANLPARSAEQQPEADGPAAE
ncbi:MAG: recombinase RecA [Armatimonadota bacterium]